MKYFTPQLLARCRSEDDAVADAAREDWERANEDYEKRLEEIRPVLPRSIRNLLTRWRLHDARVQLVFDLDETPHCSISAYQQGRNNGALELRYRLALPPRIGRHEGLAAKGEPLRFWLYDEVDVKDAQFAFTHSILFNGGYELQLTFYDLSCRPRKGLASSSDHVIDPATTIIAFVEGGKAPFSPLWKQPTFLPLGA